MRRTFPLAVFVTAVLAGQLSVNAGETAGDPPVPMDEVPAAAEPAIADPPPERAPVAAAPEAMGVPGFNGFAAHRLVPDLGAPGSPAFGFSHFLMPMDRYTNWYRPRAATLTRAQRCAPDNFRPRGLGHLFARPCDGYRMEYSPYTLSDGISQYGPSYIHRQPDARCPHCDHPIPSCLLCPFCKQQTACPNGDCR